MKIKEKLPLNFSGRIKIWKVNPETGLSTMVHSQKNTILYRGADILAQALSGDPVAKITHFYVGYSNASAFAAPTTPVDKDNQTFTASGDENYLRVPLSYPATFFNDTDYENNIVVFTSLLSNPQAYQMESIPAFNVSSKIYDLALVSAQGATSADDVLFSRVILDPILENDPRQALSISWGIKFTA